MSKDITSLVLGSMAASYITKEEETVSVQVASKPKKQTLSRKPKEEVKPAPPQVLPDNMPAIGSLDGKGYIMAVRNAGKNAAGLFDKSLERADIMRAIHGYIGYSPTEDFGAQEYRARSKAMLELRPVKSEAYSRTKVAPTIKGFVHGSNNPTEKKIADLKARIQIASESQAENLSKAHNESFQIADRELALTLADVEEERIENMREELKRIESPASIN